ncbi:glycosyltransferase family 2 protein [Sneathiella sp.]|uniref:glycosyltransferase family 2 protein n=1 Tax=Sneathiella sp. TaxID=1964365 RepID=UPI003566916B
MTARSGVDRPDLSIIIPCKNEEENALAIYSAVLAEIESLGMKFEIIFIDNDSTDRTVESLRRICASDPRVRLIINARDYGQMRSPVHAIFQARGRAIIGMCADFQDPPSLLPEFVTRWRNGAEIVLGVRQEEKSTGFLHRQLRNISYWLSRNFSDYPVIPNATGFGLYSARAVDAIRKIDEPEPFFRGLLVETGYRLETISYDRPERAGGKSKNSASALLDFAMSALAGSSKRLLRIPIYIGALGALMTLVMLIGGILAFCFDRPIAGWFIAAIVQAEFALLFGFLGLLGDNLRIISERTRRTPLVLERERVNFPPEE